MEVNLDINSTTLIIQITATLLLFVVVSIFFAKPMKAFMAKREEFVQASFNEAEEARVQASTTRKQLDEELAAFKAQSRQRLEEETMKAQAKADKVVDDAKDMAAAEIASAQAKIERERNAMLKEVQAEIVTVTTKAAEKLIKKEIDENAHDDLFDEFVRLVGGADE